MNRDSKLLLNLTNSLNNSLPIINNITSLNKNQFSQNDEFITVSIGLITEIKEYGLNLSEDLCFVNKPLYDMLNSIISYSEHLFDKKNLLNTYKLYDCLKVDVVNLINYLNNLNN